MAGLGETYSKGKVLRNDSHPANLRLEGCEEFLSTFPRNTFQCTKMLEIKAFPMPFHVFQRS